MTARWDSWICRTGKCRTGKWLTTSQGWKLQDWQWKTGIWRTGKRRTTNCKITWTLAATRTLRWDLFSCNDCDKLYALVDWRVVFYHFMSLHFICDVLWRIRFLCIVILRTRPTQPFIPTGSVDEYQLWLGRQRQVWFIPLADERGLCS